MIGNILCSTGAFSRDPDRTNPSDIARSIERIDCDGIELIFYPVFYDDLPRIRSSLKPQRDRLKTLHTEKSIGPLLGTGDLEDAQLAFKRLALNVRLAVSLEIETLVLHLWGLPDSDNQLEHNLSHYEECVKIAELEGCILTVESIPCVKDSPLANLRKIATNHHNPAFTLDTEFLALHNQLGAALADDQIMEQTLQIHIKDFGGDLKDEQDNRVYLHPGEGDIDFHAVFSAVAQTPNSINLCLESTSVTSSDSVDFEQIERDLGFISNLKSTVTDSNR